MDSHFPSLTKQRVNEIHSKTKASLLKHQLVDMPVDPMEREVAVETVLWYYAFLAKNGDAKAAETCDLLNVDIATSTFPWSLTTIRVAIR